MGHNVGDAAARSVKKSEKTRSEERTTEQILKDARKNASQGLSVTSKDILFILDQRDVYESLSKSNDAVVKALEFQLSEAQQQIAKLTEENDQFRKVYELENRNASLRVDVLAPEA